MTAHIPVLLDEVLTGLAVQADGYYIDATYGRGGHSAAILSKLSNKGRLLVMDRDPSAIAHAQQQWGSDERVIIHHTPFASLQSSVEQLAWQGKVQGILMDVGVSSIQLDEAARGFSFRNTGPLDMRMDPQHGESAAQWLNTADEQDIADVLFRYGQERYARAIARKIIAVRSEQPLQTTLQLANLIVSVFPASWQRKQGIHPATRSFQAIRIHVNDELNQLQEALQAGIAVLCQQGRMAVISFHSGEDKLVKHFFKKRVDGIPYSRHAPLAEGQPHDKQQTLRWVARLLRPSESETKENPRSRSARLRIVEKL